MVNKIFFRCTVCNDIHFGVNSPEICPTCQAIKAYKRISTKEAKKYMNIK